MAKDGRALLGDYCLENTAVLNIFSEIVKYANSDLKFSFSPGPGIDTDINKGESDSETAQISKLAEEADLFLCVVGESSGFGLETLSGAGCDRASIELPGAQREPIRILASYGKPIVLIVLAGWALAIAQESKFADAMLYCYYLGEVGAAVKNRALKLLEEMESH